MKLIPTYYTDVPTLLRVYFKGYMYFKNGSNHIDYAPMYITSFNDYVHGGNLVRMPKRK